MAAPGRRNLAREQAPAWARRLRCVARMTRRSPSVPIFATAFGLLVGCVDDPTLLDEVPDGGDVSDIDAGTGTGVSYSHPLGGTTYRWPNAEIPFKFSGTWSTADKQVVTDQMDLWEALTRVSFIDDPDCSSCLVIDHAGSSCNSNVGTSSGSYMHLPTSDNCVASNIVMHELGHVIGLAHEHQRSDRDTYVTVHPDNLADSNDSNFDKATSSSSTEPVGAYEYSSVMHYRAFGHTGNGRMTLTRNDSWGLFDETKQMWRTGTTIPVNDLKVGDFNGDGVDDVMYRSTNLGWIYSSEARGNWFPRQVADAPPNQVRVGKFDGDARADLIWADGTQWRYSSGGEGPWQTLHVNTTTFPTMRVVDWDGDGDSDFVRIASNRFQVSIDGLTAFISLPGTFDNAMTIDDVIFGNFVGDSRIDAVRKTPGWFNAGLEVSDGLDATFNPFRSEYYPNIEWLRPIDIDGTGRTDLIRIGSNSNPDDISYEVALGGTGAWTDLGSDGVEDFGSLVIGNFDSGRTGQEMLVNGYHPGRASQPTFTDRGGVAHIYYGQVLLSTDGQSRWQYWDDAPGSGNLAQYQIGDFDGDGKDDLFLVSKNWLTGLTSTKFRRMNPDPGADPSLYHGNVGWKTLTLSVGVEKENIAIGHFVGDARMDVFRKNGNWWEVQDGGVGAWQPMMYDATATAMAHLGFADFNADGVTDILKATGSTRWQVSWGGRTVFENLDNPPYLGRSNLRFGDFTGDGRDDVVASFSGAWWISSAAETPFTQLRVDATDIRSYRFGHFNGDNRLDIFRVNPTNNLWWEISPSGTGNWTRNVGNASLASSAIPASSLAIGHFSGPGPRHDVIGFVDALVDDNANGW